MKKVLIVASLVIIVVIYPFLLQEGIFFWNTLTSQSSYITIKELHGIDTVYIDNSYVGKTPLLTQTITPGEHTITVQKTKNTKDYYTFQEDIITQPNANTIISLSLGPTYTYSFFEILSLKPIFHGSAIYVNTPDYTSTTSSLYLNSKQIYPNKVLPYNSGEYELTYNNTGYLGIHSQITIPSGYILEATIHLVRKPL